MLVGNESVGYIKINVVQPEEVTRVEFKSPGMDGTKTTEYKSQVEDNRSFSEFIADDLRKQVVKEDEAKPNV